MSFGSSSSRAAEWTSGRTSERSGNESLILLGSGSGSGHVEDLEGVMAVREREEGRMSFEL